MWQDALNAFADYVNEQVSPPPARARYDNGWESVFGRAFREYVEQRQP